MLLHIPCPLFVDSDCRYTDLHVLGEFPQPRFMGHWKGILDRRFDPTLSVHRIIIHYGKSI